MGSEMCIRDTLIPRTPPDDDDGARQTEDGDDDDGEVEDVPRLSEVVPAQADQLDDALDGEDADEDAVDVVQDVGQPLRLVVVLDRHRRHVEQDHQHYADVELLVGRQLEEHQLTLQLHARRNADAQSYRLSPTMPTL